MTDRELLQQVLDAWQDHWVNDHQSALLEMIRANCANCARCGEKNPAEIHTCTPKREPSGSWTSWDNTMCNPVADARMQTQSAWQDGYDSAKAEWQGLTDEDIKDILDCGRPNVVNIKKAERKLKEKNT